MTVTVRNFNRSLYRQLGLASMTLFGTVLAHGHHHHHDHSNDHDLHHHHHHHHHHNHGGLRRSLQIDEAGETGPIEIMGQLYPDEQAFIESGHACGFEDPGPERMQLMDKSIKQEKVLMEAQEQRIEQEGGRPYVRRAQAKTIPIDVYFWVVHTSDGTGDVSDATVENQIDVLNKAFSGERSQNCFGQLHPDDGIQTPFHFRLVNIKRVRNNNWFNSPKTYEYRMKSNLRRGGCSDLNVYTTSGDSLLGWSSWPDECSSYRGVIMDGVVINYSTLPGGQTTPFNLGDTLVHEVGHWLGLYHTFEGGCDGGDKVHDTSPQKTSSRGCPVGRNSCGHDSRDDPIHNFMDYTDDCCMYKFTAGQVDRMKSAARIYRNLQSAALDNAPTPAPTLVLRSEVTNVVCTEAETKMTLDLLTDGYGTETTWTLKDSSGYVIASGGRVPYPYANRRQYTIEKCLSPGSYTFKIMDVDGICCDYGNGVYSIKLDEMVHASGRKFTGYEETAIVVATKCKDMALSIHTDNWAEETSWTITNMDGDTILESDPYENNRNYYVRYCLPTSDKYTFTINDSADDGLCCHFGEGSYTLIYDGQEIGSGGMIGSGTSHALGGDCQDGYAKFELDILTDDYPTETSWSLKAHGVSLHEGKGYTERSTSYHFDKCYPMNACYEFEIRDSALDGLCCAYGQGSWSMKFDDTVYKEGVYSKNHFTSSRKKYLGIACKFDEKEEVIIEKVGAQEQLDLKQALYQEFLARVGEKQERLNQRQGS